MINFYMKIVAKAERNENDQRRKGKERQQRKENMNVIFSFDACIS